jgi:hypothetical protein
VGFYNIIQYREDLRGNNAGTFHPKRLKIKTIKLFCLENNLCECTLDLLVPQAVNHRVQHGDDHSVEHRCDFVCVHGMIGTGL